ncbi:MAG: c-type cytochrome [Gammaproteobacteria bacterium]|nr:c-type cytochrome [Gammaproteobacteria bacterium]
MAIGLSLMLLGTAALVAYIYLGNALHGYAAESAILNDGARIAQSERTGIQACIACHGARGEGNRALGAPRIAGLAAGYIEKQLRDFARDPIKTGVTLDPIARDYSKTPRVQVDLTVYTPGVRRNAAMNAAAAALDNPEIHAVALYFSALPYQVEALPSDPETLERGEDLALRGKPEYGVPACTSCHGPNGRGFGDQFPPLVGQAPEYIIRQLNHWQTGARDNDTMALMRNVSDQLTDGDKINVAAYFANVAVSSQDAEK